jgi:hypothetical protein
MTHNEWADLVDVYREQEAKGDDPVLFVGRVQDGLFRRLLTDYGGKTPHDLASLGRVATVAVGPATAQAAAVGLQLYGGQAIRAVPGPHLMTVVYLVPAGANYRWVTLDAPAAGDVSAMIPFTLDGKAFRPDLTRIEYDDQVIRPTARWGLLAWAPRGTRVSSWDQVARHLYSADSVPRR